MVINTIDTRIIKLIGILKANGTIRFDIEFCRAIELRKQNLYNIRCGKNRFTPEHIRAIVREYNVNANWIFGVTDDVFRVNTIVNN